MKMHELLDSPGKWTKGFLAKSSDGDWVDPNGPKAICWCLLGASAKCYRKPGLVQSDPDMDKETAIDEKVGRYIWDKYGKETATFNDDPKTTFEQVRELLLELDV